MYKYLLLILILISCKPGFRLSEPQKLAESQKGMVVTAHQLATDAGLQMLQQGGNAVDAAIAAFYALAVVYPRAGNLGGGGFAIIRSPEGQVFALDFREKAPIKAHKNIYLDEDQNVISSLSKEGGLAVGVPGSVYGMHLLHDRWGRLTTKDLMQPAIDYAKSGFQVGKMEAKRLNNYEEDFKKWNSESIPFIKKESWENTDKLTQKDLAKTLKILSKKGMLMFYAPPFCEKIIDQVNKKGGIFTQEDFASYDAIWRSPVRINFKDYTLFSMPPPSSGGITLGQILKSLENYNLDDFQDAEDKHLMIEAERRAFADRATYLGDPDFYRIPMDSLLDSAYLKHRMSNFDPDRATPSDAIASGEFDWSRESFETTHLCTADRDGWVVSLTTTLNSNYGSKVFVPELGIFLNNEMDDFSAKPGVPNQYGLIGNEANAIEAEKRMLSSMTPTIIDKNGDFFMALGTPGGSTIITSVAQVFLNVVEYEMPLKEALDAPRFHHQWWPDVVMHEADMASDMIMELESMGHQTKQLKSIGLMEVILQLPNGIYQGVADHRGEDDAGGVD